MYSISAQPLCNKLLKNHSLLYKTLLVFGGSLFIALAAQITVPLYPVPITLQTLAVLFVSMTFGWRLGVSAVLLYLIEGSVGFPVFSNFSGGIGVLLGPRGGYLAGFLLTAFISGFLSEYGFGKNFLTVFIAGVAGLLFTYLIGLPVLAIYVGIRFTITLGVMPFILAEFLKLAFLGVVVPYFWKTSR